MMNNIPRFEITESWDSSGDIIVWFHDNMPYKLQEHIAIFLNKYNFTDRCPYLLEKVIEKYLQEEVSRFNLRKSPINNYWIWDKKCQ